MYATSGPVVELAGFASLRDRDLSLTTSAAALVLNPYPPYESRVVDGWSYIEIDSAVTRPAALRSNANWVAFQGRPGSLPVPDRTLDPTFLFEFFDHLTATPIVDAQYIGPKAVRGRQVRFRLPEFDVAPIKTEYTVTIGPDDRIDEIESTLVGESGPNSDLTLTWRTPLPPISAPPSDEVQILTPGQNLYPATTTTTTPSPGAIGESDAIAGNKGLFDADHTQIEATLRAQSDPKLTAFAFDATTNTISVAFAYQHPAPANQSRYDAFAWGVAQNLADTFWSAELVQAIQSQHIDPAWLPKLRIQLDKVVYVCPSVVQIAVGAHGISQHDWVLKCAA